MTLIDGLRRLPFDDLRSIAVITEERWLNE
jgi:hypothetical protein